MAVFGSTINPALGRVDYSPLAQGMAQGGALAAQGMAAMGQGLSEGFREYVKKREQNAILEGKNAALLREIGRDPMLASNPEIQKYTAKMAKGGVTTEQMKSMGRNLARAANQKSG